MVSPERVEVTKFNKDRKPLEDNPVLKLDEINSIGLSLIVRFSDQLKKIDAFKRNLARIFFTNAPKDPNTPKDQNMVLFRSGDNMVTVRVSPSERRLNVEYAALLMGKGKIREPLCEKVTISPAVVQTFRPLSLTAETLPFLSYEITYMDGTLIRHENNQGAIEGAERMLKILKKGNRKLPFLRR